MVSRDLVKGHSCPPFVQTSRKSQYLPSGESFHFNLSLNTWLTLVKIDAHDLIFRTILFPPPDTLPQIR